MHNAEEVDGFFAALIWSREHVAGVLFVIEVALAGIIIGGSRASTWNRSIRTPG
jgi:hypothetical protein